MGTPRIDNIETFANKTLADHGSNLIINGNFDYWQRGTTFTGVGYGADRFQNLNNFVGGGFSVDQLTDVPNINSRHSIRVIKTVSGTTSFSELGFRQWMEKQVFRRIVGKKATVGFWVKSNLSLLSGRLSSNAGFSNNDFNFNINISQANVWEYKTFLIDLSLITETIGIAENQHGGFLDISFGQTALGFGQTSVALNDYFQISQVQVLEGDIKLDGSSFNYSTRNSLEEFNLCRRYYAKVFGQGWPDASNGAIKLITAPLDVAMRIPPVVSGLLFHINGGFGSFSASGSSLINANIDFVTVTASHNVTGRYHGELFCDAEL